MKVYFKNLLLEPNGFQPATKTASDDAIPAWISDMGLEWLYRLLARVDEAWKPGTARHS